LRFPEIWRAKFSSAGMLCVEARRAAAVAVADDLRRILAAAFFASLEREEGRRSVRPVLLAGCGRGARRLRRDRCRSCRSKSRGR
jgi:hypothetical protein